MQNAGSDSRLFRPALGGLALTMLVAASPAAAGEETASAGAPEPVRHVAEPVGQFAGNAPVRPLPALRPRLLPMTFALDRDDSTFELAYRMTDGLSLGAGGSLDPLSGAFTGLIAVDIRF